MNSLKHLGIGILLSLATTLSFAASTPPPLFAATPDDIFEEQIFEPEDMDFEDMIGPIVLVDESPAQVLSLYSNLTGKSIILNEKIPAAKINFTSNTPLSIADTITALESALAVNGVALTPIGGQFLKAVPANTVKYQSAEWLTGAAMDLPPSQKVYTKLFDIKHHTPSELRSSIAPLLTQGASIFVPFNKADQILITDTLVNLQTIEKILHKVDHPTNIADKITFYELKHTNAVEVQKRIKQMTQSNAIRNNLKGSLSIEADSATNQLIVMTHSVNTDLVKGWINNLDKSVDPFTKSETFRIKYAEAVKVAEIIQKIIDNQKKAASDKKNVVRPKGSKAVDTSGSENLQFSDYVTVVPDERSNAIVAYGSKPDLEQIQKLIKDVDVLLAQVRIEVVIAEVTLNKNITEGIEAFNFKLDGNKAPSAQVTGFNSSVGYKFSDGFTLDMALKAAKSNSNVEILSAPTIMTTHNKEASIQVTSQHPVVKGQQSDAKAGTAETTILKSTIEYKEIGLKLTIKPLIGSDGIVQLEVKQILDEITGTIKIGGIPQPIISNRQAESFVSIADQEVIVLGGLQRIKEDKSKSKLALIGSLPLIGNLLGGSQTRKGEKTELIIFIKPYILKDISATKLDTERIMNALDETGDDVKAYFKDSKFDDTRYKNFDKRKRRRGKGLFSKKSSSKKRRRGHRP